MKPVKKMRGSLTKPPGKRGFSRVDLIIFLSLALLFIINLLIHVSQPAPATVSSVKLVSMQAGAVTTQAGAAEVPSKPSSRASLYSPSAPADSCVYDPSCFSSLPPLPDDAKNIKGLLGNGKDNFLFITAPSLTVKDQNVQNLQGWMLGVVDAVMVILLILTGLKVMLGGSVFRHANAIEMLPGVLLALVAANFSLPIVTLFLGLNNALSVDLYNTANARLTPYHSGIVTQDKPLELSQDCNDPGSIQNSQEGFAQGCAIGESANEQKAKDAVTWDDVLQGTQNPVNLAGGFFTNLDTLWDSIKNPLQAIASILALMLIGQIAIRIFLLDFYIILAPLGIACWAVPARAGQSLTRMWLQGFFTTLFSQFLQVAALIVLHLLVGGIADGLKPVFNVPQENNTTLLWILVIAEYWFVFRIPSLLGGASTSLMVNFGQTISQAAQTVTALTAAEVQMASSLVISGVGVAGAAAAR